MTRLTPCGHRGRDLSDHARKTLFGSVSGQWPAAKEVIRRPKSR